MTIVTRKLDQDTYNKTEKYLQQVGMVEGENLYGFFLELHGGADEGQILDALIYLQDNKISIKNIWIMEHDHKKGMLTARNFYGEKGCFARILGEKYLNRFFEDIATVEIVNIKNRQYMVTSELIEKIEAEIDQRIDPKRITETEISSYDRIELILSVENALHYLCKKLDEGDYHVFYNHDAQLFEISLISHKFGIKIPLGDIVRKKWEMNESLAKASIAYAGTYLLRGIEYVAMKK